MCLRKESSENRKAIQEKELRERNGANKRTREKGSKEKYGF